MISRVTVKEAKQDATSRGVHDLVDTRKREQILQAVLVKVGVIDTHP
jgi:hypothetical protein